MLGKINKKDLAARAKKMKAPAQALPTKKHKLKIILEAAPTPTEDEETYSGPVFKRRRKAAIEPSELSVSNGRAPSKQAPPPSPPPPRDMVVVQEGEGTSIQEEGLWDLNLDAPSFLEKMLLPTNTKEKLDGFEEDYLVEQVVRQLGQALATNCLVISKLREWKGSVKKKSHEVTELLQQVGVLKQETSKLHEEL